MIFDLLGRIKRRAVLIGGPIDGYDAPIPLPDDMPWPRFQCVKNLDWLHYVYVADNRYEYAGACADIDHDGCDPHEHVCCCEREGCDGSDP